jgi:hypothetical protein
MSGWLERFKAHHRWLQLWDRIPDQTHIHHTLVTILFGVVGLLFGMFQAGLLVGIAFYVIREIVSKIASAVSKEPLYIWDGIMDVVVPMWIVYPWIFGWLPGWLLLSLFVALMYGPLRKDDR